MNPVEPTEVAAPAVDVEIRRLYELHVDDIYRFVARRLGTELAFDVTADTFRTAYERLPDFVVGLGTERGWLYGIASNLIRNHWRTERRRLNALARLSLLPTDFDDSFERVDDLLEGRSRLVHVLDGVAQLAAHDRDLLLLFAWEGCSYNEIATALEIPVGTVRSRLNRIRTILHAHTPHEVSSHE